MKTVIQVKGNPVQIVNKYIESVEKIPSSRVSFSRFRVRDDSIVTYYYGDNKPFLLMLLHLKQEFEIRRIDARQTSIYFKERTIMAPTPDYLSRHFQ